MEYTYSFGIIGGMGPLATLELQTRETFKNNNVGLILVEKGKLTTILKPTLVKGHALDIKYYIADKLLKEYIQLNPLMG